MAVHRNSKARSAGAGDETGSVPAPFKIDPETYYPEEFLASAFGREASAFRRMRREKSILPYVKMSRRVFYRGSDIIAALDHLRRASTSEARP